MVVKNVQTALDVDFQRSRHMAGLRFILRQQGVVPVSYTHLDVYKRQADVFVSLIAQKYGQNTGKENLVKTQELGYNKDEVQKNRVPSGLCG